MALTFEHNNFSNTDMHNWTEDGNVGFVDGHVAWCSGKVIKQRPPDAWGLYNPFVCY